ncbi:MAG: hypothetical protein AAGF84_08395 [Planctomycetota bacterium]
MRHLTKTLTAAAATLAFVGFADAASVYSFDLDRQGKKLVNQDGKKVSAGINDRAGKVYNVSGSYDELNQTLSWSTTASKGWESFWLVINNGGNPKSLKQEGKLGMIYFDRNPRGESPTLSVYQYTSAGGNSYKNGELIASSVADNSFVQEMSFDTDGNKRTGSFTIDVSGINSALGGDWQGVMFDETIGLWMHLFDIRRPGAKYNNAGDLTHWHFCKHGWVDTNGFHTEETNAVPTPSAALAGLAGLGLLANRRKRQAA